MLNTACIQKTQTDLPFLREGLGRVIRGQNQRMCVLLRIQGKLELYMYYKEKKRKKYDVYKGRKGNLSKTKSRNWGSACRERELESRGDKTMM